MAFEFINKLPTPAEIKEQFPLPAEFVARKAERDEEVKKVIRGESDKFLVIIGPCSADNEDAVLDYTSRLINVQEKTKDRLLIVPRVYTNKPPSLSLGRYTEIDSLPTGLVFRYGLRNMLMTSRDANSHRWFSWDVFMDAYLYDPINQRDFSNLFSFMRWNPVPWMEYRSEMQAPILGKDKISGCHEYNNSLRFMPWRSTEFVVRHRYLNQHSLLEDSSQLDLRVLQRFSEAWAFSGKWRFSLLDGKLDIQEYNVYHNMGSWYLGVGAFVRKNGNKNEFGLGISFTIQQTGDYMPVKFL